MFAVRSSVCQSRFPMNSHISTLTERNHGKCGCPQFRWDCNRHLDAANAVAVVIAVSITTVEQSQALS